MFREIDQNQRPGLDQVPMYVQIGIYLDGLRCSEYDHFARECPSVMTEDDSDPGGLR